MHVVLTSAMRNNAQHVERYFDQVWGLRQRLKARGDTLATLIGEGDSTDDTRALLADYADGSYDRVIDTTHGGPAFGHVIDPTRFRQLAAVYNRIWAEIPLHADAVIFVEGDLIWRPETLLALVDHLNQYPAVAPMAMHLPGYAGRSERLFFDRWGYRRGGMWFTNEPPYHPEIGDGPLELDSAGSCIVLRAAYARQLKFPAADMVVGLCRELRKAGGSLYLLPWLEVCHP